MIFKLFVLCLAGFVLVASAPIDSKEEENASLEDKSVELTNEEMENASMEEKSLDLTNEEKENASVEDKSVELTNEEKENASVEEKFAESINEENANEAMEEKSVGSIDEEAVNKLVDSVLETKSFPTIDNLSGGLNPNFNTRSAFPSVTEVRDALESKYLTEDGKQLLRTFIPVA